MDIQNSKNHIFNVKWAKLTGLYQILNPETVQYCGHNIYHIAVACVLLYIFLVWLILIISCLYYWSVNIPLSMDYFWKSEITLYVIYKMWFIVRYSNDIWNCLSITRYDFTSFSNQNRHVLDRWRDRLALFTTIYAIIYASTMVFNFVFALTFSESKSVVKNHDGSIGYYRQGGLNLYLIVSDETYNAHYYTFYFIEVIFLTSFTLFFCVFDIFLVTLCFGVRCQLQMICTAFESVGHKSLHDLHSPIDSTDESKKKLSNEYVLIYEELKTIIMDHQLVMKKYEDFLTLYRRVILIHIFISSFTVILLCVTFMMGFSNNERFHISDILSVKIFCIIPSILFQIYMVCYIFGNLDTQKDSIIFALYSSNWTEFDMKCKKSILLTMKMNNAYQDKLKFTSTRIVNLEMFFKTMGDCYTVISVLVNYIQTNNE